MRAMKYVLILLAALLVAAPVAAARPGAEPGMAGRYDAEDIIRFDEVIKTLDESTDKVTSVVDIAFAASEQKFKEAERKIDEGRLVEAVRLVREGVDAAKDSKSEVLDQMWSAQASLAERLQAVRDRLALAVGESEAAEKAGTSFSPATESRLNALASLIGTETDPMRRERLETRYRTIHAIARMKIIARRLTPSRRRLLENVLAVLERASTAHFRLSCGMSVLYAQLDTTSACMEEYRTILINTDKAREILERLGSDDGAGLLGFVESMNGVQSRLDSFQGAVEEALNGKIDRLNLQLDEVDVAAGDKEKVDELGAWRTDLKERMTRMNPKEGK